MGQKITRLALEDGSFQIIAAYTILESPNLGKDLGLLIGKSDIGTPIVDVAQLEADCKTNPPDVMIDFTLAGATEVNAPVVAKAGVPLVIGTTGLSNVFHDAFTKIIVDGKITAVVASNMATGVNIFFKIAAEIAKYVKDWDVEIIEAHHHRKRDAPSGTAMTVATKIAEVLERNIDEIGKFGRDKGPNPRKVGAEEIGVHAVRAGDIVGDHLVMYAGAGERIELVHRAHSRDCFASGTLRAAKFLMKHQKEGKIYDMQAVLGL